MGNLVRKKTQILVNSIDATSVRYAVGAPLFFKEYNEIAITDTILKFKKSSTAAGTSQVSTITPAIVYPLDASKGAELYLSLRGKENLGWANGPGRVTNMYLGGQSFQAWKTGLAAPSAGMVAAADIQALIDQIVIQINNHPLWKTLVVAAKVASTLTLTVPATTAARQFQFDVLIGAEMGTVALTTPGVYPKLTLADIQRIFPVTQYQAGSDLSGRIPVATLWDRYYFKVKRNQAYSLDGASHVGAFIEEFEFYLPDGVGDTAAGSFANWDKKIYDYLTARSYSDPSGDTTPWGLVIA